MKIKTAINKLIGRNEIIALWYNTDKHFKVLLWRGEAWRIPNAHLNLRIDKIFGTIPHSIIDADTINICVKDRPVKVECKTCKKWGNMLCPNSHKCYALDDHPYWEWRFGMEDKVNV